MSTQGGVDRDGGGWRQAFFLFAQMIIGIGGAIVLPIFLGTYHASDRLYLQIVIGTFVAVLVIAIRVAWLVQRIVRSESTTSGDIGTLRRLMNGLAISQTQAAASLRDMERANKAADLVHHDLLQLQQSLAKVEYEERNNGLLLVSLITSEIAEVKEMAEEAALHLRIPSQPNDSVTSPLLESLGAETVCSFFHYSDNNAWFFNRSGHSFDYNKHLVDRVKDHRLGTIRRIIVVTSPAELRDPATWVLALFHQDCPNFDYRIVGSPRLRRKVIDGLPQEDQRRDRIDCGVYGDHYIYLSLQDPNARDPTVREVPRGIFSANKQDIRRYQLFFDGLWELDIRLPPNTMNAVAEHIRSSGGGRTANSRGVINDFDDLPDLVDQCCLQPNRSEASVGDPPRSISHLLSPELQNELERFERFILQ
jgi:hypothetical protein